MNVTDTLRPRYQRLLRSDDSTQRQLAAIQLQSLGAKRCRVADTGEYAPSPWRHVSLAELLIDAGNKAAERSGIIVSGHEPVHGSRSGTCLIAWPDEGRWWCSSCRKGGDGIALLMSLEGLSYRWARAQLTARFGGARYR